MKIVLRNPTLLRMGTTAMVAEMMEEAIIMETVGAAWEEIQGDTSRGAIQLVMGDLNKSEMRQMAEEIHSMGFTADSHGREPITHLLVLIMTQISPEAIL